MAWKTVDMAWKTVDMAWKSIRLCLLHVCFVGLTPKGAWDRHKHA